MRSNTYTLVFTSIVTIVLGFFLALAADGLRDLQDLNVENDMRKNILLSLGFKPGAETPWTSDDIQKLFEENIEALVLDASGQRTEKDPKEIDTEKDIEFLPIYLKKIGDEVGGYAIPIAGKGLWSTLYGYFAIEPDGRTVKGIKATTTRIMTRFISTLSRMWGPEWVRSSVLKRMVSVASKTG